MIKLPLTTFVGLWVFVGLFVAVCVNGPADAQLLSAAFIQQLNTLLVALEQLSLQLSSQLPLLTTVAQNISSLLSSNGLAHFTLHLFNDCPGIQP